MIQDGVSSRLIFHTSDFLQQCCGRRVGRDFEKFLLTQAKACDHRRVVANDRDRSSRSTSRQLAGVGSFFSYSQFSNLLLTIEIGGIRGWCELKDNVQNFPLNGPMLYAAYLSYAISIKDYLGISIVTWEASVRRRSDCGQASLAQPR